MKCLQKSFFQRYALRSFILCFLSCFIMTGASCTFPPKGHYSRMEKIADETRVAVQKNEKHNEARNEKELDEAEKKAWRKEVDRVAGERKEQKDSDPFGLSGNMLLTLAGILVTVLGGGAYGTHKIGKTLLDAPSKDQHGMIAEILKAIVEKEKNA